MKIYHSTISFILWMMKYQENKTTHEVRIFLEKLMHKNNVVSLRKARIKSIHVLSVDHSIPVINCIYIDEVFPI